jgi:hypothetical protein
MLPITLTEFSVADAATECQRLLGGFREGRVDGKPIEDTVRTRPEKVRQDIATSSEVDQAVFRLMLVNRKRRDSPDIDEWIFLGGIDPTLSSGIWGDWID